MSTTARKGDETEDQPAATDDASSEEGEATREGASPPPEAAPSTWAWLRSLYFSFDRRTLGFTRILLGFFLITDILHRASTWMPMYSNEGVLPAHLNLFRPQAWGAFSIFNAFATRGELIALWIVMFVTFSCLLLGYKTKLAQVLSLIFVTGMNGRVLLVENGGYVVHNLLLLWTCFLPLGDRFSLDAMLASMERRREATADDLNDRKDVLTPEQEAPHVTVLGLVLLIQLSAIYFFNVIHKTGPTWKNGTAVHYVLYVDRMVTPIIGVIRDRIPNWMIILLTKATLFSEAAVPVLLLQPLARAWSKRFAIVLINAMHIGFGTTMVLGPFAWACCTFSTLLFSPEDWDIAARTMRRARRARVVLFDPRSGGAIFVCRVLKRLDRFELLSFEEAEDLPLGLAVRREGGEVVHRSAAIADVIAALPLGPCGAWILRVPGLEGALDALFAGLEQRDLSRWFGLRAGAGDTRPGPSSARRGAGHVVTALRELAILAMFAGAVNQAMVELWVINRRWKFSQPEPLATLSHKMRFLQGWFMFSPNPVMDDGTIVVDAITIDGRHLDPFTRKPPAFDIGDAKSFGYNQIWCDYYNRIRSGGNSGYRDAMRDYMLRLPERTGDANDAIVSGDVYWTADQNPPWNEKASYKPERQKLFSFENPALRGQGKPPSPAPAIATAPATAPAIATAPPATAPPGAPQGLPTPIALPAFSATVPARQMHP